MSVLYILLAPLAGLAIGNHLKKIRDAIATRNSDKLKIHAFFLALIVLVLLILIYAVEYLGT